MKYRSLHPFVLFVALAPAVCAQTPAEVFFSVSRARSPLSAVPVDAEIIERKEIASYRAQNPAELLQHLPSVSVRRMNGAYGASVVSMRGFLSKQTAVVADDMKLPADLTGTVDFSALSMAGIDRIEVLPGGWSPLYGANAEGGVIHLISRPLQPGARRIETDSEFSSYGGRFHRLRAGFAEKKVSARVSAANEYSEGFQRNSAFVKNAASGVFSFGSASGGLLTLRGFESASRTGLPSGTPVPISDWDGRKERQANRLDDYQKTERNMANAGYEFEPFSGGRLSVSAGAGNNVVNAFQYASMTRISLRTRSVSAKLSAGGGVLGVENERGVLSSDVYGRRNSDTGAAFGQMVLRPVAELDAVPTALCSRQGSGSFIHLAPRGSSPRARRRRSRRRHSRTFTILSCPPPMFPRT
jgi:outer membrane cobalamin receptor